MRVGIVILPDQRWEVAGTRWRRAEEYGFAHAWTYDHIGWRDLVDGPWFDAAVTLTAAAAATSSLRLGTLVASPNFRHPVHFAREVTALDDVSGGRFMLGAGVGGLNYDAAVLGQRPLTPRERVDRFGEFLDLLDRILRGEHVTHEGAYFSAVDARGTPGCVQVPRVPFVVAATGPRTMRLAARYGAGWVTTGGASRDLEAWWAETAAQTHQLDAALEAEGRQPGSIDRYLLLDPGAPVYSLSSVAFLTEAVERAAGLGFTDVVTTWPRESGWFAGDESVLDDVATTLLDARSAM
ncbi:LLM class flavin-dependent oxidoreductase [Mumia zhuanghuii]|uniref:LLM class flavin-dependent oxidoreductase n=2 Tax=Mumia TaxID=1546255 RepID=A0ABW1QKM2_9ACTN|nr:MULTISPECIES: LLM class flavin-dependent oxidoreductase [Mumia]KAA1424859.1 LLM class flavin-dependent oxidoreductase [Mumia zhuanghuii]